MCAHRRQGSGFKTAENEKLFFGETVDGWGVIRDQPWRFAGVYSTREEAEAVAMRLGQSYAVRFGQNKKGTGGFRVCATRKPALPHGGMR